MFLHIGADVLVRRDSIVAICDMTMARRSVATRELLELAEAERRLSRIGEGTPKSFVLCDEKVILSPISCNTLLRRAARTSQNLED